MELLLLAGVGLFLLLQIPLAGAVWYDLQQRQADTDEQWWLGILAAPIIGYLIFIMYLHRR